MIPNSVRQNPKGFCLLLLQILKGAGNMDKILLAALGLAATIIREVCDPED